MKHEWNQKAEEFSKNQGTSIGTLTFKLRQLLAHFCLLKYRYKVIDLKTFSGDVD